MNGISEMFPAFGSPRSPLQGALDGFGWTRIAGEDGRFELWSAPDMPHTGVLVPLDPEREDYQVHYERAVRTLEGLLGVETVRRRLAQQLVESERQLAPTSWKRETSSPPGTIALPDGEVLHATIARQLGAAARAAVEPMPKLGRSNIFAGRDYLENSLLAPSGAGSYVVTVLVPLHRRIYLTAPEEPQPDKPARPRRSIDATKVLQTFDIALDAVTTALDAKKVQDAVEAMKLEVPQGVSQELVESLAHFVQGLEAAVVVPRQIWMPGATAKEYSFEPKDTIALMEAAEALGSEPEPTSTSLTGVITQLRHERNTPDYTVHVFTTSRGPVGRVRVNLTEDDYQRAVEAHRNDSLVRISGTLAKDGKFWWIQEVQQFHVLGEAEQKMEEAPLRSPGVKASPWTPLDFESPF